MSAAGRAGATRSPGAAFWTTWSSRRMAVAIAVAGTLAILALDALVRDEPTPRGDDLVYDRMAEHPLARHTFVFAYRIALPWLVHVLPFDRTLSFSLIAWICSGVSGAVLFLILERFEIERRISIPLALALALSPPLLVASLRQGRNPDPETLLVMTVGVLMIIDRRPRALALTMLIGALVRESALFLAPLAYACWAERVWDRRLLLRVAAITAPAAAAFVALRLTIPTVGAGYTGGAVSGRLHVLREGLGSPFVEGRRLLAVYGPLWLLAPAALAWSSFARRSLILVPLCLASMAFALDWGRVALIAAPVVYAAGSMTLQRHPRWRLPSLVFGVLLIFGYAAYMQASGVDHLTGFSPYPIR
jgi:hypothetical protein